MMACVMTHGDHGLTHEVFCDLSRHSPWQEVMTHESCSAVVVCAVHLELVADERLWVQEMLHLEGHLG